MSTLFNAIPGSPAFEQDRAGLARVFNDIDAGDTISFYALAHDFYQGNVTPAKIEHAGTSIIPVQIDRRLDAAAALITAYSAGRSLMQAQRNYVISSPALARLPVRAQLADAMQGLHSDFDRLAMKEYSKGLRFMRDLSALGINPAKNISEKLFQARISEPDDLPSPLAIPQALEWLRTGIMDHAEKTRALDLEIAQFKMIDLSAHMALGAAGLRRGDLDVQYAHARALFDSTANPVAPGIAAIDRARELAAIMAPAFMADKTATKLSI